MFYYSEIKDNAVYEYICTQLYRFEELREVTKLNIGPSFKCSLIQDTKNLKLVIIAEVDFRTVIKKSVIKEITKLLNLLGMKSFVVQTYPNDSINSLRLTEDIQVLGDSIDSYKKPDLSLIRALYNVTKINISEAVLNDDYNKKLSLEKRKILEQGYRNILIGFKGHKNIYVFDELSTQSVEAGNELLRFLNLNYQLVGKEILNVSIYSDSIPFYDLEETLESWHGNSIQFFFYEEFNLMDMKLRAQIIQNINELINEFGKTVLFILYFHHNVIHIQNQLINEEINYNISLIETRNLSYLESCEYVKNEIYKYWGNESKILNFLAENPRSYSKNELKKIMSKTYYL